MSARSQPLSATDQSVAARSTFREKFCARFGCSEKEFEQLVLLKTMPPTARVLAKLTQNISPSFFEPEYKILEYFGGLDSAETFILDAKRVPIDYQRMDVGGFLRNKCAMRISGRRLLKLRGEVW